MRLIRKLFFALFIILFFTFTVHISTIQAASLNAKEKTLSISDTYILKVNGSTTTPKWTSTNKKVATVNSKGKITAVSKGTTTIKAKVGKKTYSCKIIVKTAPTISNKKISLLKGSSYTLKMKDTTKTAKWTSSNKKIATVNSKGKVTAISKGTTTIKAKIGKKTYSCKVTVDQTPTINKKNKTLIKRSSYTLKITNTNKSVKWTSSNKKVATVNSKGKVTAVGKGTATIKATVSGKSVSCKVKVETPSLEFKNAAMLKGSSYTLKVKGNTQPIKWSTSNKKIATVNSKGKITAVSTGNVTITATIAGKKYACKLIIEKPYFSSSTISLNLTTYKKVALKGTTQPVKYKSSNICVAKVNSSGVVYGIKAGTAKITATVYGQSYTYTVTVNKATSISGWKTLSGSTYYYQKGTPVVGLNTINNRKYNFNNTGSLSSYFGIDVSEFQGTIDWEKVKADGVQFALIRCGYGENKTDQDDSEFARNISECKRLGISYGVYIYSYANTVAKAKSEAQHVLRLINGYNPPLGIWYDVEDKIQSKLDAKLLTNIINTFCQEIKNAKYTPGIYSSVNWLSNKFDSSITNTYPVWVAQYYDVCQYDKNYILWQYSSDGKVNGINARVGYNIIFLNQ